MQYWLSLELRDARVCYAQLKPALQKAREDKAERPRPRRYGTVDDGAIDGSAGILSFFYKNTLYR